MPVGVELAQNGLEITFFRKLRQFDLNDRFARFDAIKRHFPLLEGVAEI
jgi:hypothetical protein